jgi:hypothetical protein
MRWHYTLGEAADLIAKVLVFFGEVLAFQCSLPAPDRVRRSVWGA